MKSPFFIDDSIDRATKLLFRLAITILGILIALVITYLVLTTNSSLQIPFIYSAKEHKVAVVVVFPGVTSPHLTSFDLPFNRRYLKYNSFNHE